jgi:hypothetical protein
MRKKPMGDTIIGYYAGMSQAIRYWHVGEQGDELVVWSSSIEAHRYLVRTGVPQSYHHFYPMVFGEIIAGLSLNMVFRLSQGTMARLLDVWREDLPDLPPTLSIDLGEEEYVRFPPLEVQKKVKSVNRRF